MHVCIFMYVYYKRWQVTIYFHAESLPLVHRLWAPRPRFQHYVVSPQTTPANPDTVTPVRLAIQTCEKTCKKFALNVLRHDNAD